MPLPNDHCDELILAEFEKMLQAGDRPALDPFLEQEPVSTRLLVNLIKMDLDYRLRDGEAAATAQYLDRYPALKDNPPLVAEVVAFEQEVRLHHGRPRPLGECLRQYRDYRAALVRRLGVPEIPGYEIEDEVGRGGMGVVYKARDTRLNRPVALKLVLMHLREAKLQERLTHEARAVARLQHPGIVQVFETGQQGETTFVALEWVPGGNLERKLNNQPQPPRDCAELVRQLALAMQAAHEAGVVHRDLKPANVLLTRKEEGGRRKEEGRQEQNDSSSSDSSSILPPSSFAVKITDFGLARVQEDSAGLTQSGVIVGTPAYMAPEQIGGQATPGSDLWALGAILYQCLTGRPPFVGHTVLETLEQVKHHESIPPRRLVPSIPRDLETIALKCLRKDPARRYASAATLADDLGRFLRGESIKARPVSATERMVKWARRRPVLAGLTLFSVLAIVALVAGGMWYNAQLRKARDDEADKAAKLVERNADLIEQRKQANEAADAAVASASSLVAALEETIAPILGSESTLVLRRLDRARRILQPLQDRPTARLALADVLNMMALVNFQANRTREAERLSKQALKVLDQLDSKAFPSRVAASRARAWRTLGKVREDHGQWPEAGKAYRKATDLYATLARQQPTKATWRMEQAIVLFDYATNIGIQGKVTDAQALTAQALALWDGVAREAKPLKPHGERYLAYSLQIRGEKEAARGYSLVRKGQRKEAQVCFDQARKHYETATASYRRLRARAPWDSETVHFLARSCSGLATLLRDWASLSDTQEPKEVLRLFEEAASLMNILVKSDASRTDWFLDANLLRQHVFRARRKGKTGTALVALTRAYIAEYEVFLKIATRKVKENPASVMWLDMEAGAHGQLLAAHWSLAGQLTGQQQRDELQHAWRHAEAHLKAQDDLARRSPTFAPIREKQIAGYYFSAGIRQIQGNLPEARKLAEEGLRLSKKWQKEHKQSSLYLGNQLQALLKQLASQ